MVVDSQLADGTVAACEHDQAVRFCMQPFGAYRYVVAMVAFEIGARNQSRQAKIAAAVLTEQGDARDAVFIGHQHIGARNRLDANLLGGAVELHQAEQIVQIGQRERGLFEFDSAADQVRSRRLRRVAVLGFFRQPCCRIAQRKLAVDVQMDEARGHACEPVCRLRLALRVRWDKA